MNLTRALDVALPDIPAREILQRVPRVDPGITFREHIEDGERVVRVYVPSNGLMYRLTWAQWSLARLFDGNRSYAVIAELYSEETGAPYDEQTVYEFASELETAGFWYRTAQEKNVLLLLQSKEERRKNLKAKSRFTDLSMITFPAFNPDGFLNWLYPRTRFIYSRWFTILTLLAFSVSLGITVSHWSEIGRDTIEFYNFAEKTVADIAVLYLLGIFVVAVHEFAHAHACKHAGGRVPAMGFALIFLTPAFYTDTTEGAVMGGRTDRLVIALAGIWVELMICSIATPVWWLTAPDTVVHEGAYFMMMLTGIVSLIVNWNPLMKLDGYHMLCEIIGIAELKEDSTAYLSAWVKRTIWRLPVEVPYVPKRRRPFYAAYALLSGAYSYLVLTVVARFAGNVSRNFSPEWAFVPEYGVALLVFKSRIRLLVNFMKLVYLDKKDRVRAWIASRPLALTAAVVVFCLLPLWHQSTSGRFVLEPARRFVVRAEVPGVVSDVFVDEGSLVRAGEPLARLRNLPLRSEAALAEARLLVASSRAITAEQRHGEYGAAMKERDRLAVESAQLRLKAEDLELLSPMAGVVLTPRVADRIGSYLTEGTTLLEVADVAALRARIYVSEYDMYKVRPGAPARLYVEGTVGTWDSSAVSVTPAASPGDPTLADPTKFKGLRPPQFYAVEIPVSGSTLKPGMAGTARVYGQRRSLVGLAIEGLRVVLGRKIW
ncbi:MAG TPA: HlyD family efflux transporter periplasmic adaptor subunit [Candidatus Acidoferrum sp.]|nr:HlyD family efflux transporter periplasmic adaptor subunit [Candidatus Acidoferrum sp.]